jgi:sugar phosphate isomerase/epimerase
MKLAVSMWSYFHPWKDGNLDIPGFIHAAKEAGAEGVELLDFFYNDPGQPRVNLFTTEQVTDKRNQAFQALQQTGLPCPIFSVANNFAKLDPSERAVEVDKIKFGVDEALSFNAKVVRVFAGDVHGDLTFEQVRTWIVEGLAAASEYAHAYGIRLALENHGKLAGRGDQVRSLIQDVRQLSGNDALGANPDTGNFLLVNQPSHEAIEQVADLANMVHFKDFISAPADHEGFAYEALDGSRFVGTAVGEGEVQLATCINSLKSAGFDGWLSVEYEGEESPFTAVPRSISNARTLL